MEDDRSVSFFQVHHKMDIEHAAAERDMVEVLADAETSESLVLEAVDNATSSLYRFLDGVYETA